MVSMTPYLEDAYAAADDKKSHLIVIDSTLPPIAIIILTARFRINIVYDHPG